MVQAHGAGRIDLSEWTGSRRDWLRLRFAIEVEEAERYEKVQFLEAFRGIVTMLLQNTDQSLMQLQQYAVSSIERYRSVIMPWLGAAMAQNGGGDPLDDLLDWYAEFRPDLLEAALDNG